MHVLKSIVLVPMLALAAATTVSAQTGAQGREAVPDDRGYVSAYGGAVAGPAAPAFAVEYGDNANRNTQAYIALSYFENLMKQPLRDDLPRLEQVFRHGPARPGISMAATEASRS